jgi:hypothetical protein
MSATHYYVWYRVAGDFVEARAAVAAVVRDVSLNSGVAGRVLVRRDDPRTWLEIYENVFDAQRFEHALTTASLRHEVARFAENGQRHVEPFVAPV